MDQKNYGSCLGNIQSEGKNKTPADELCLALDNLVVFANEVADYVGKKLAIVVYPGGVVEQVKEQTVPNAPKCLPPLFECCRSHTEQIKAALLDIRNTIDSTGL